MRPPPRVAHVPPGGHKPRPGAERGAAGAGPREPAVWQGPAAWLCVCGAKVAEGEEGGPCPRGAGGRHERVREAGFT